MTILGKCTLILMGTIMIENPYPAPPLVKVTRSPDLSPVSLILTRSYRLSKVCQQKLYFI